MNPHRLWAKSWRGADRDIPRSASYTEHLRDVYHAAQRVLRATGDDQLTALGLPPATCRERFHRLVLLAAALHDLGKANDHFQAMILGSRNMLENPQGVRHEWVTILMMQRLRDWLMPALEGSAADFAIVEWGVAGHHPAVDHSSPPQAGPDGAGTEMTLQMGHPDFAETLEWIRNEFSSSLGAPPQLLDEIRPLVGTGSPFEELARWQRTAIQTWDTMRRSPDRRLVAAVKNCLLAADIAGSAVPRVVRDDKRLWDWIDTSFSSRPREGDLEKVAQRRLGTSRPREFQQAVASSKANVTFVKAGCGSGKTLAAYMWGARNHPTRRLYFCYPTTGTATEGFKDYLFEPDGELGELGARLFHGRSDIDFEIILSTGPDVARAEVDAVARIESLDAWSTPIVSCTVDTVLGIVQNNRRGQLGWPALSQSAFVFDEIHAFDDRLFGALLRFLRDLPGLPVLLMTASLPEARVTALRNVLSKFGQELQPIAGPADLEERPRYHRLSLPGNDPISTVKAAYESDGKILWVCNTVQRVIDAARAAEAVGLTPILYHSRFRYVDRVERHKQVIEAFRISGPALAICSQVAEMSLDLSADLLVTDLAPVPAMIQRLGRLNRRAQDGNPTRPFAIVDPGNHLPYALADVVAANAWLKRLPVDRISQKNLADHWEQSDDSVPAPIESAWLDGGPTTMVSELRDASPGISVLLEADAPTVMQSPQNLGRYVLPMPPRAGWQMWPRVRAIPVAPSDSILYEPRRGAEWRK